MSFSSFLGSLLYAIYIRGSRVDLPSLSFLPGLLNCPTEAHMHMHLRSLPLSFNPPPPPTHTNIARLEQKCGLGRQRWEAMWTVHVASPNEGQCQ